MTRGNGPSKFRIPADSAKKCQKKHLLLSPSYFPFKTWNGIHSLSIVFPGLHWSHGSWKILNFIFVCVCVGGVSPTPYPHTSGLMVTWPKLIFLISQWNIIADTLTHLYSYILPMLATRGRQRSPESKLKAVQGIALLSMGFIRSTFHWWSVGSITTHPPDFLFLGNFKVLGTW